MNITSAYRAMNKISRDIITEEELDDITEENINEALIVLGNQAYPNFGQIVIMSGGSGSGKGFVINKLLAVQGKIFDVDALKTLSVKSNLIKKTILDKFGINIETLDIRNPEHTSILHNVLSELGIKDKQENALIKSVLTAPVDRKPNLIFDVTLKDLQKLQSISSMVKAMGYKTECIHIVWIINDIKISLENNERRGRRVRPEILIDIHQGVSKTMTNIVSMGETLAHYMDGDIVFAFNKLGIDNKIEKSKHTEKAEYITTKDYFVIKKAGKPILSVKDIEETLRRKIASYVPHSENWV